LRRVLEARPAPVVAGQGSRLLRQPATGTVRSRRIRSTCKDRSSGESISRFAVAVSRLVRWGQVPGALILGPRLSVTAGRAFEIRHSLTWLDQDRVELIAVTALPFNLHGQLRDGLGGLCQSLHTLCPKLRFAHGRLSRLRFQT
jgi:hypothetical protein